MIVQCPALSDPDDGVVTMNGTSVGDNATYLCEDGYELNGTETVSCLSDGSWSSSPTCIECTHTSNYKYGAH